MTIIVLKVKKIVFSVKDDLTFYRKNYIACIENLLERDLNFRVYLLETISYVADDNIACMLG